MGRWEPNARGRLQVAALELFAERGFEQTTVAEIANRAGLAERTFFRHFADKREVLFGGAGAFEERFQSAVNAAPPSFSAIDAIGHALELVAAEFPVQRDAARLRQAVITANTELQERERIKLASLALALASALRRRGVKESGATVAGELGVAVFKIGFERWIDAENNYDFVRNIRESMEELKAITAGLPGS
jgi:AcrR family transcriptional regulator